MLYWTFTLDFVFETFFHLFYLYDKVWMRNLSKSLIFWIFVLLKNYLKVVKWLLKNRIQVKYHLDLNFIYYFIKFFINYLI